MMTTEIAEPMAVRWRAAIDRPETKGIALGLFAAAIWGAYLAMAKAGVSSGLTASDIAVIRYGIAGLIMLPWLVTRDVRTCGGVGWKRGIVLALLVGPLFILIGVGGYRYAPLAHGAVMQPAALTILSIILAAFVLKDRPTFGRLLGIACMLTGLAIIAGPALLHGGSLTPLGDAMFIAAGSMWAVFTLLTKRWNVASVPATAAVSVLSAAVYVPYYYGTEGIERLLAAAPSMLLAQALVQGVLSGVVAVLAFTKAASLIGTARAAVFPALVPAVAVLFGIPIAGEWPNGLQVAGLGLVSLGLLVAIGAIKGLR